MARRNKFACIGGALVAVLLLAFVAWSVAPLRHPALPASSTKILDRNGGLLYEVVRPEEGRRTLITRADIPPSFVDALIASEDQRFYSHHGVDVIAITRAFKDLVRRQEVVSGASTLEQQVVKNLYFADKQRTIFHKLREATAAIYWSFTHTKDQTLEAYVNTIFFGNQALGLAAASQTYFHKPVQDLTLAESALLVGVIPAPSAYDPYHYWKTARLRQQTVLSRMADQGLISSQEQEEAVTTAIDLFPPRHEIRAPHFVFHVLEILEARYPDIRTGGYTVRTSLDPELQQQAEQIIGRRIAALTNQNVTNGAVLVMSPRSGDVLAYVGSRDYFSEPIQGQVNMVAAKRQPGSALKPFLYFQAFQQGFTPASVIADLPVRFETTDGKPYYPRNYGYRYHGPVSIRESLGSSLNIPAVKVLQSIGLHSFVGLLSRFSITFPEAPDYYGLALVLGGGETSLVDVTRAYASLALSAKSVTPIDVLEVRDRRGVVREQTVQQPHEPLFPLSPLAEQAAWLVTDILTDKSARLLSFGSSNLLDIGKRVAVKTGTTKDFRDNWAFGYTPEVVVGVWVGNADNSAMQGVSGITGAVPIWHDVMQAYLNNTKDVQWPKVEGLITRRICVPSGKLAGESCAKKREETFIKGTEPTEVDDWYVEATVEAKTGLLATSACRTATMKKIFLHPPPEYDAWLTTKGVERLPTRDCEGRAQGGSTPLTILSPLEGDLFERETLLVPDAFRIPFIAGGERRSIYRWKLNGMPLESNDPTLLWSPQAGIYTLELEGADRRVRFSVQ